MNEVKKILILIIFVICIIIFLLLVLLFPDNGYLIKNDIISNTHTNTINNSINVNDSISLENNIVEEDVYEDKVELERNKLKYVEDKVQYFTMKAIYNNYISLVRNNEVENLMDILSDEYVEDYKVTSENVIEKIGFIKKENNQKYKAIIMEVMLAQIEEGKKIYIIKGNCRITDSDNKFPINVIIEVDTKEKKYEIYPNKYIEDREYDKLKVEDTIEFTSNEIKENENNQFSYLIIENYAVAKEYFDHYKELLLFYPDEAYKRLDQEYYKSRFENRELYENTINVDVDNVALENINEILSDEVIEEVDKQQIVERKKNYEKYLDTNAKRIKLLRFDKYIINDNYEEVEYIVQDKFGNTTVYISKGFLNYTVRLDGYTDNYIEYTNVEEKILEFQNVINTKDYQELYFGQLDEKFAETNFKNVSEFEEYMEENFYTINAIVPINITEDKMYYICECKLVNQLKKEEIKKITLIISDDCLSFNLVN